MNWLKSYFRSITLIEIIFIAAILFMVGLLIHTEVTSKEKAKEQPTSAEPVRSEGGGIIAYIITDKKTGKRYIVGAYRHNSTPVEIKEETK